MNKHEEKLEVAAAAAFAVIVGIALAGITAIGLTSAWVEKSNAVTKACASAGLVARKEPSGDYSCLEPFLKRRKSHDQQP